VGISDPCEFIAAKSQRIPFKAALSKPSLWQDAFKNWPLPPIAGWRNWYKRVLADKQRQDQNLGQPPHFSMLGAFFSRDPEERRPFDSSLSFLVK
jgi:hypothetical protein